MKVLAAVCLVVGLVDLAIFFYTQELLYLALGLFNLFGYIQMHFPE